MKETILRSKKFLHLILQIFDDNRLGMLGDDRSQEELEKDDDEGFFIDNDIYAFEVFKLLNEANKRGIFKNIVDEVGEEVDGNIEEILI